LPSAATLEADAIFIFNVLSREEESMKRTRERDENVLQRGEVDRKREFNGRNCYHHTSHKAPRM